MSAFLRSVASHSSGFRALPRLSTRTVMAKAGSGSSGAKGGGKKGSSRDLVFDSGGTKVLDRGAWKRFKYCAHCQLIMVERAKWKNFEEVKYCSDKCKAGAKRAAKGGSDDGVTGT